MNDIVKIKDFDITDLLYCINRISEILENSILQMKRDLYIAKYPSNEGTQRESLITCISNAIDGFEQIKEVIKNTLVEANKHKEKRKK